LRGGSCYPALFKTHQELFVTAEDPNSRPDMDLAQSCNQAKVRVQWSDLPLCCPMPGTALWSAHPRVYLAIHRDGHAKCGYCGTEYVLEDPPLDQADPVFTNMEIEKDYRRAQAAVAARRGKTGD